MCPLSQFTVLHCEKSCVSEVFSRFLWQELALWSLNPDMGGIIFGSLCLRSCRVDSICNTTSQVAFSAQVSLEPEFKRQACLSGDILGSGMGLGPCLDT